MRRARWTAVVAGVTSVLMLASPVMAQPTPPPPPGARPWADGVSAEDQRAALVLFQEGNKDLKEGVFKNAADKYREALTHWDHPAIHYNLALALVQLDQPLALHAALQKAMQYGEAPLDPEKFDRAEDLMKLVQKQLATVEYSVSVPGAVLVFDGKEVFTGPGTWSSTVTAGEHAVLARADGYVTTQFQAKILGGEAVQQDIKMYTERDLLREKRLMPNWIPYTVAGVGLAVLGGGVFLHQDAKNTFADYDEGVRACAAADQTGGCRTPPAGLFEQKTSAENKQSIAIGAYALGGTALAAGITLFVLNRPQMVRIKPKEQEDDGVSVTPVVSPHLTGIAASGRF